MLSIFRRIRKGLLGSGQARKYMVYALGEFILIVAGILVAMQINNWNDNKNQLGNLLSTLKSTNAYIFTEISQGEKVISDLNKMLLILNSAIEVINDVNEPDDEEKDIIESAISDLGKIGLRTYNIDVLKKLSTSISDSKTDSELIIPISKLIQEIEVEKWIADEYLTDNLLVLRRSLDRKVMTRNLNGDIIYEFHLLKNDSKFHEYVNYSKLSKKAVLDRNIEIVNKYRSLNDKL